MADEKVVNHRDFSKVVLTLENVLVPSDKVLVTPSLSDGLSSDIETDLRILGCELIQTAGILLKLPQVAMATGQLLYQRFYYSKSFVKHNMEVVAMACINLASKIEEAPRRIRDVANVFHHIKQVLNGKTISPLILDQNYISLKNHVIKAERRILKELGFCVHIKHPHKIIVMYLQVLQAEKDRKLVQMAWNYMNDSFRTNVFVRYQPETIACACIFLAARQLQIPLPNSPPWYALFGATEDQVTDISIELLKLYQRKKPNADKLEKIVEDFKKVAVEAKLKAKGQMLSGNVTPSSRPISPAKVDSPMPKALSKIKQEDDNSDSSGYMIVGSKKKRGFSRSRSRSRSDRSGHSDSRSPAPKKRYSSPNPKKHKDKSYKDKYSKKDRYYDNDRYIDKYNDKYSNDKYDKYSTDKYDYDYYRDKSYDRDHKKSRKRRSVSYSPEHRDRSYSRSPDYKTTKKHYSSRSRSPYPAKKSKKRSNGHHRERSVSRERYRH